MTFLLLKAIKEHLEETFKRMAFRESDPANEKYRVPRIHIGALPPKRQTKEQGEDYPYIVVRGAEGEDDSNGATATVVILCGIYTAGDDEAGANDIQNMVDRCRICLLQRQILDNKYGLIMPVKWRLGDNEESAHPHPYYLGTVTTRWALPAIEQLLTPEQEVEIYGSGLL